MAKFITAYVETAEIEGGYSNDPKDPGGETWRGIARKKNPSWRGWLIIDSLRKKWGFPTILKTNQTLQDMVMTFYKSEYWDRLNLDNVDTQKIANKLFDIAVNIGQVPAAKMLQRALNVLNQGGKYYPDLDPDGKVGNATIKALNSHPRQEVVFKAINALQGVYYISKAEGNHDLENFTNGWFENRVAAVLSDNESANDIA